MESTDSNDKKHDVDQGKKRKHDVSMDSIEPTDESDKKRDVNQGKKRKHDVSLENSEPTDDNGDIILK